jgi:hypothetical protein
VSVVKELANPLGKREKGESVLCHSLWITTRGWKG